MFNDLDAEERADCSVPYIKLEVNQRLFGSKRFMFEIWTAFTIYEM